MTKIKFCGLTRTEDIASVNELMPEYIGFVFVSRSKRFITQEKAAELKQNLNPGIKAVGVFEDEELKAVARLLNSGLIDIAQLHGKEDDTYITRLRKLSDRSIMKAFRIQSAEDVEKAVKSSADLILLDADAGAGRVFDWSLIRDFDRPYFLAGGLDNRNVTEAIQTFTPYGVDVSSGIETNGKKDKVKMTAFAEAVRKAEKR